MKPELLAEAPQIIREFLGYLGTIKGKSEKTVEDHRRRLAQPRKMGCL